MPIDNSASQRTWKNQWSWSVCELEVQLLGMDDKVVNWFKKDFCPEVECYCRRQNIAYVALLFVGASRLPHHSSRQDDSCHLMPHLWYRWWIRGSYPPVRSCTWNRHLMPCWAYFTVISGGLYHHVCRLVVYTIMYAVWWFIQSCMPSGGLYHYVCRLVYAIMYTVWWFIPSCMPTGGLYHHVCRLVVYTIMCMPSGGLYRHVCRLVYTTVYAITNIQARWAEIKESTTNAAWRKIWP